MFVKTGDTLSARWQRNCSLQRGQQRPASTNTLLQSACTECDTRASRAPLRGCCRKGVTLCAQRPHTRYDYRMGTPASSVINLRTPAAQRELIDRAAQLQGKSRTEFMLEASRERAQQVLLDQNLFNVTPKQYKAFLALMDAPLADNAALQRLLSKRSPWEK